MNLAQAFKMAFKSIASKKTRSFLTMLGIIIGVASVVIMVSVVQGQNRKNMEYFEKMGDNKIQVYAYQYYNTSGDISELLYEYCLGMQDLVLGITPNIESYQTMTIKYGAKTFSTDNYDDWSKRISGVAILEAPASEIGSTLAGVPVTANYDNFMDWIRQAALDEIYVDIPMDSGESFIPVLEEMESMGLTVHFRLLLLDRIEEHCCGETSAVRFSRILGRCAGGNIVTMGTLELKLRDRVLKRAMDIVGGLVGCIISVPIIAITAIPLKLESPGPLIFKQKRVGLNGRVFYIHKLRSMYMDAEERKKSLMTQNEMNGLMFKMQDDPRITKVGKFIRKTSIDELPQFFDVLRGDMSLVGTRPPTLDEYKQYESHHKRRLSMKPGITGLWQVSGRSNIEDFEEVVRLDVKYIDNWSLWGDIKILFKTVYVVFAGRGAK